MKQFFLILYFLIIILLTGCSKDYKLQNPYDIDTGHYAGYEWAKKNYNSWFLEYKETGEVPICDGNSESFIEGYQEYLKQEGQKNMESSSSTSGWR